MDRRTIAPGLPSTLIELPWGNRETGGPPFLLHPSDERGGRFWLTLFTRPILCRIPSTEIPRDFEGGRNLCPNLLNISGMVPASSYFQRDGGGETREKVSRRWDFSFFFGMEWKFNVKLFELIFFWSNLGGFEYFFGFWIMNYFFFFLWFMIVFLNNTIIRKIKISRVFQYFQFICCNCLEGKPHAFQQWRV